MKENNKFYYSGFVDFDEFSIFNTNGNFIKQVTPYSLKDSYDDSLLIEKYVNNIDDEFLSYDINFKSECTIFFPESIKDDGKISNDGSYIVRSYNKNVGLITQLNAIDAKGNNLKVLTNKYGRKIEHSFKNENDISYPVKITVEIKSIRSGNYYNYFSDGYWQHRSEGVSLSLYPKKVFYLDSTLEDAWTEVIYMHRSSPNWYNEAGMYKQFKCHNMYAPNKRPWNLEPWRPNVSMGETIAHRCNP